MKAVLRIEGMHCGACALTVDDALEELDGVTRSKTSFARARAKVNYDESRVGVDELRRAIAELGYDAPRET